MGVECPSPHRGKAGHADLEKALDMRGFGSCRRVTEADFHIGRIGIRRSRSAIVLASGTRPSKGQSKAWQCSIHESASWNGGEQACVLIR